MSSLLYGHVYMASYSGHSLVDMSTPPPLPVPNPVGPTGFIPSTYDPFHDHVMIALLRPRPRFDRAPTVGATDRAPPRNLLPGAVSFAPRPDSRQRRLAGVVDDRSAAIARAKDAGRVRRHLDQRSRSWTGDRTDPSTTVGKDVHGLAVPGAAHAEPGPAYRAPRAPSGARCPRTDRQSPGRSGILRSDRRPASHTRWTAACDRRR